MKKLVRLAVVVTLLGAALGAASPPTPAGAASDACVMNGIMQTQTNVYSPGAGPSASGGLSMSLTGTCLVSGSITLQGGSFTPNPDGNYCGKATLTLTVNNRTFTVNWTSNTWRLSAPDGSLGAFEIEPDSFGGQSCTTGATQFILSGTIVFEPGGPPVPLGGPAGPSDTCGGAGVTSENPVEITAKANTSPIEICVRAGIYGGRFVVTTTGGAPPLPALPTTDTNATACTTTAGNTIAGSHPIVGPTEVDPGDHVVFIDAYASGDQVWVCAKASSTSQRLLITIPGVTGLPNATVTFDPDTGTPDLL